MSMDALQPVLRRQVRTPAAPPSRLLTKGPEFFRPAGVGPAGRKQSAVERLEADKAKYVKSPVALTKQRPIRVPPPVMRKPLMSPPVALRPTRKTPARPHTQQGGGTPLDLEHLSNLINGVSDAPPSPPAGSPEEAPPPDCPNSSSPCPSSSTSATEGAMGAEGKGDPGPPDWSSPGKVRVKALGPVRAEAPGSGSGSGPTAGTIRRVDVMPQTRPVRTAFRGQQQLMRLPLHPHLPLRPAFSPLHLFHPRTTPGQPSPLKPIPAPPPPDHTLSPASPSLPPLSPPGRPPNSPAVTRLSSSSSRKRPSLTRSKSDMSDRCSRAGTDMERFFNLCGLDPADLPALAGPGSDIMSITRLCSASAPGSEVAGAGEEEEEEEGVAMERPPYGVSVIERNARVIKWLYSVGMAKNSARNTTV